MAEASLSRTMSLGKGLVTMVTGLAVSAAVSVEKPLRGLAKVVLYRGGAGLLAPPWGLAILLE